jgi:hypothetical protein
LTRIESKVFSASSLQSITIPRSVQILCSSCFSRCSSLSSIFFETNSQLTRIETRAFGTTCLSLAVVPGGIKWIAGDAFAYNCGVRLAGGDSDPEFLQWNQHRQCGCKEAFQRRI